MSRSCTEDQSTEKMSYDDTVLKMHTPRYVTLLYKGPATEEMSYEDIVMTTHISRFVTFVYKERIN